MRILFILDSVENPTSANVLMAQRLAGVFVLPGTPYTCWNYGTACIPSRSCPAAPCTALPLRTSA